MRHRAEVVGDDRRGRPARGWSRCRGGRTCWPTGAAAGPAGAGAGAAASRASRQSSQPSSGSATAHRSRTGDRRDDRPWVRGITVSSAPMQHRRPRGLRSVRNRSPAPGTTAGAAYLPSIGLRARTRRYDPALPTCAVTFRARPLLLDELDAPACRPPPATGTGRARPCVAAARSGSARPNASITSQPSYLTSLSALNVSSQWTWPVPGVPRSFSLMWTWASTGASRADRRRLVLLLDVGVEGVVHRAEVRVVRPSSPAPRRRPRWSGSSTRSG